MGFQDRAEGWAARLHLGAVPKPVFLGVALLLCVVLAIAAVGLGVGGDAGGFEVVAAGAAEASQEDAESSTGADGGDGKGVAAASSGEAGVVGASSGTGDTVLPAQAETPPRSLCVHVDGAVASPGVYYLDEGSRVIDAVEAAGGVRDDAVTATVNLAQELEDGQQVVIPAVGEESEVVPGAGAGTGASGSASSASSSGLININTASASELTALSGIGEATAAKIVADREANGPFASVDDLTRVSGIGEKKLEAIRDAICV
ncbi:ComEA family DNA-binding protein [uncultured Adlercreutzia sp.]|uniref:ComEA family DNA-binding protein n=1 Tax=uncultured Adlercreutzia sp. TaxID=875803 RepID=UPI0025EF8D67|nr:ComEA family DNA-binding protein [uncultured Adlercreutzia sp.]